MKKICIVTGGRSDYDLLRVVMVELNECPDIELQIIATGMHLSPEFGLTYQKIKEDGFTVDREIEVLISSDSPVGVAKSMGLGLISFSEAFNQLNPDMILVLGDRFEIFSAVSAALVARIPVAHLHGGELTEGAYDEALRHSITKMSHLHFVATDEYRKRVIQLGEDPNKVFVVGGLGVDAIRQFDLLDKESLEKSLNFKFGLRNLLITFHPATLSQTDARHQMQEILAGLESLTSVNFIFTMPNSDNGSRALIREIKNFVASRSNASLYTSLGQHRYLSCLQHVDGVVGNSSSGLTEVPSFKKGTINIGNRQRGRIQANSVINCEPTEQGVSASLEKLFSTEFQKSLVDVINPYGDGGAGKKIVDVIRNYPFENLCNKVFFDLSVNSSPWEVVDDK